MIHIYRASTQLGVALFDLDTGNFLYGEICTRERLVALVNNFPDHPVILFVENSWEEELTEIYYLLPHLQESAQIKIKKNLDAQEELLKHTKKKPKKKNMFMTYLSIGIILGCIFLLPTSLEYKNSVMIKAQSIQDFTTEFVENKPNEQSMQQLYTSLSNLYLMVRVDAVTYSNGTFKVVFSSANANLTVEDLEGFETASLVKVSSLENEQEASIHIYELEGIL